ncbi:MAG: hypothetical protein ACW99Q_29700, partial [Candidatus Kariarchaeaceae archaeon]|jgi:ribosomal protein L20
MGPGDTFNVSINSPVISKIIESEKCIEAQYMANHNRNFISKNVLMATSFPFFILNLTNWDRSMETRNNIRKYLDGQSSDYYGSNISIYENAMSSLLVIKWNYKISNDSLLSYRKVWQYRNNASLSSQGMLYSYGFSEYGHNFSRTKITFISDSLPYNIPGPSIGPIGEIDPKASLNFGEFLFLSCVLSISYVKLRKGKGKH